MLKRPYFLMMIALGIALVIHTSSAFADRKVTQWTLFIDDGNGKPFGSVNSFEPKDHVQHFEAKLNDVVPDGTKVRWTFTAVDTAASQNTKITEIEFTVGDRGADTLKGTCSLPKDWPVGKYRVDIALDGNLLDSFEYEVADRER